MQMPARQAPAQGIAQVNLNQQERYFDEVRQQRRSLKQMRSLKTEVFRSGQLDFSHVLK